MTESTTRVIHMLVFSPGVSKIEQSVIGIAAMRLYIHIRKTRFHFSGFVPRIWKLNVVLIPFPSAVPGRTSHVPIGIRGMKKTESHRVASYVSDETRR